MGAGGGGQGLSWGGGGEGGRGILRGPSRVCLDGGDGMGGGRRVSLGAGAVRQGMMQQQVCSEGGEEAFPCGLSFPQPKGIFSCCLYSATKPSVRFRAPSCIGRLSKACSDGAGHAGSAAFPTSPSSLSSRPRSLSPFPPCPPFPSNFLPSPPSRPPPPLCEITGEFMPGKRFPPCPFPHTLYA